jgi:hypothetical protein
MPSEPFENRELAARLREAADLLEAQGADPFRVAAYRRGADTVASQREPLRELLASRGIDGLDALPGIGRGLASALAEMIETGRWQQLERMRGAADPVQLFRTIPGVGPGLAGRLHDALHVDTLEALEVAAHDGRLASVEGIGPRRSAAIRDALTAMLDRARRRPRGGPPAARPDAAPDAEPDVSLLLAVDAHYRRAADAGTLPTIAPRRFNPDGRAWLPVLHDTRDGWHFTALFSNTARAHELGRVRDWVVLYFHRDGEPELQRTVVTEAHGPMAGRRVVRGRERECAARAAGP